MSASQPRLLDAARAGVGACLWDSSLVLTAFLCKTPPSVLDTIHSTRLVPSVPSQELQMPVSKQCHMMNRHHAARVAP